MPSLYEFAGGMPALHRLEQTFYDSVLRDPLLQPLFGAGQPQHVEHLTMFTAESFGGPPDFTDRLGFAHLIAVHRGLHITEPQRRRFVELYLQALDAADMPTDPDFRVGSPRAPGIRHAGRDAELERAKRRRFAPIARGPALDLGRRRPGLTYPVCAIRSTDVCQSRAARSGSRAHAATPRRTPGRYGTAS